MKIKTKMILGSTILAAIPVIIASVVLYRVAVNASSEAQEMMRLAKWLSPLTRCWKSYTPACVR